MTSSARSRRRPDHERAVKSCLDAAEISQNMYSLIASQPELSGFRDNALAHAVRSAVVEGLRAAAFHVEELSTVSTWDINACPSEAELNHRADAIRTVGQQLNRLADQGVTQIVPHSDFERIRLQLTDLGFALKPEHVLAVAQSTASGSPDILSDHLRAKGYLPAVCDPS